jgi:hypothetical protein
MTAFQLNRLFARIGQGINRAAIIRYNKLDKYSTFRVNYLSNA